MSRQYDQLFERVRESVSEVDIHQLRETMRRGEKRSMIVDVREREEWEQGHIPGARFIPRGFLEMRIEEQAPDKEQPVYLYCAGGVRSVFAAQALQQLGYRNVASISGGFGAWKDAGYPFEIPRQWSPDQRQRYSRHFLIPEVGEDGQARLLDAKVLLIGAGGLGSPAALYLAAAGVGTLGVVDSDTVDLSNLQRQILHTTDRVGVPKTESATAALNALNPDVAVIPIQERLTNENVVDIIQEYDVVVNGADNFATRYLLNDACVLTSKPIVDGSIFRFEGQVTVYKPGDGPCYRCLFPEPPPPDLAPSCDAAGVLGVLPGVVGVLQATETIKLVLGSGEPLIGRLLTFDALSATFRTLRIRRDVECPACGDSAQLTASRIRELNYDYSCALPAAGD
jgi:sulfur-carrier protein adenylyltransferase/sulfurtransferase